MKKKLWRWVKSYWVAHKILSAFSLYIGHIVFSLLSCTQLQSVFLLREKKKRVLRPSLGLQGDLCFSFFFPCNVSFAGLSNSVLVGCYNFQSSVGCTESSCLLLSSCGFLFSFTLLRHLFLLTRGSAHKNSNSFVMNKWEQTGQMEGRGYTCSVALLHTASSTGILNVAAARGCFSRWLLGRIQTMSNSFPRWKKGAKEQDYF